MIYQITAMKRGYRDGRDCALLERPKKNPYDKDKEFANWEEYEESWEIGFQKESEGLLK